MPSSKKSGIYFSCLFCFLIMSLPISAQVINQYPLSPFGGSISSLTGAINSYNNYIISENPLTAPLDGSSNTLPELTANQKNLDAALAKAINAQFATVSYNTVTGTPIYVGSQQQINQLINAIAPNLAAYQNILNQLSPAIYTTLPTIFFNSANLQNIQLEQRLAALRLSNLFDLSNDESNLGSSKKITVPERKTVFNSEENSEQKITTFVDGNGMWSQASSVNNLPSYKTYAGGVQTGASYHVAKGLDIGPYVGYQGTRASYQDDGGSSIVDNSVRYGLFGTYAKSGFYADALAGGAFNSATINRRLNFSNPKTNPYTQMGFGPGTAINSTATGTISGGELDSLLGAGYNFNAGKLKFGPSGNVQYTYVNLSSTQEAGAGIEDLNIGTQNASSLLTTLGGQVSYDWNFGGHLLQPYTSLAWQHEFLQNSYNLGCSIMGQSFNYETSNAGRDQYIASIGANLVVTKNISLYLACNLINGDANVFTQSVFGGCNLKF